MLRPYGPRRDRPHGSTARLPPRTYALAPPAHRRRRSPWRSRLDRAARTFRRVGRSRGTAASRARGVDLIAGALADVHAVAQQMQAIAAGLHWVDMLLPHLDPPD